MWKQRGVSQQDFTPLYYYYEHICIRAGVKNKTLEVTSKIRANSEADTVWCLLSSYICLMWPSVGRSRPDTRWEGCACGRVQISQWFCSNPFGVGTKSSQRHFFSLIISPGRKKFIKPIYSATFPSNGNWWLQKKAKPSLTDGETSLQGSRQAGNVWAV